MKNGHLGARKSRSDMSMCNIDRPCSELVESMILCHIDDNIRRQTQFSTSCKVGGDCVTVAWRAMPAVV
jgi:hypothetical protein